MPETRLPRRVVSLQPSITVTLRDLGLLERLVACTKYCLDVVPELRNNASAGKPRATIIHDSWTAKAEEILAARPDLVIASVPYQVDSLAEIMKCGVPFLGLSPKCLDDVYQDILHIARVVGSEQPGAAERRGLELVERIQHELEVVRRQTAGLPRPLVYCEEWGKPLILSQRWVAELVEAAGGHFFGEPGKQTTEDQVAAANPDVIIAAWCGAGDRVPLDKIVARRGWEQTKAGQDGRVYCINDEFLNTPASTLLQGLHALAAAIHPEIFRIPMGLRRIIALEARMPGSIQS
jgi:iron complex transport system substrate-binding protein